MQQRQSMRAERTKREIEILGDEVGIFVKDEEREIAGDAAGKRETPDAGRRRLVQMKRKRIVECREHQQDEHEDGFAPDVKQRARDHERPLLCGYAARQQIDGVESRKDREKQRLVEKHVDLGFRSKFRREAKRSIKQNSPLTSR